MVQVKSKGGTERIRKVLEAVDKKRISVGIFDTSVYPDGIPVAYVAAIQEFGYAGGNIPPRPFFRPTIEAKKSEWGRQVAGAVQGAIDGKVDILKAFDGIGGMAAGDIAKTLSKLTTPPLKESTIEARKSALSKRPASPTGNRAGFDIDKPLVASGQLFQDISHRVEDA